ncbi:hypothetical protein JOB18_020968 [Solea senegalensis]|uniref:Uncharacterized protein n=1 Tax=Solea senegalensis TaxID=28829 RepID=A0AAV6T6Z9_SOLSE|nr:hypothetical protein JOB18_020968 [Solea senegalensis]
MTYTLSSLIKPAAPTPKTIDAIWDNAKQWEESTVNTLKEHYEDVINSEVDNLFALKDPEWKQPFDVAASWARRNLGSRLLPETISHVKEGLAKEAHKAERAKINAQVHSDVVTATTSAPEASPAAVPTASSASASAAASTPVPAPMTASIPAPVAASSAVPAHRTATSPPSTTTPPPLPGITTPVATMTVARGDWSPPPHPMDQGAGPPTPFLPPPVMTTNLGARPKEQRNRSAHSSLRGENVSTSLPQPPTPGGIPPPETEESRPRPLTSTPTLEPTSLPPRPTVPPTSHAEHIVDLSTDHLDDFCDNSQQTDARPGTFWSPFRKHTTQSHIDFDKSNMDPSRTNLADDSQDTPTRRPTRQ